ncbi:MAG: hypothetical protein H0Z19_11255 [Archaeoglobus sp.]|uniref:hypothetical protein n=1 Tax=Archaeoglobus sp. TaxID=1872626 RepID=UPI001D47F621|nr:hypothetical protein [Archaeoglobus sp.]MBO8181024.1 hypothetical protein [Archaeoglobus sp.]
MKVGEILPRLAALPGYKLYIEVVRPSEEISPEGEQITTVERFDATGFTEEEIRVLVESLKIVYPDALKIQTHFCGHKVRKRCYIEPLEG